MRKLLRRPDPSKDLGKHLNEWAKQWKKFREQKQQEWDEQLRKKKPEKKQLPEKMPSVEFPWYERKKNGVTWSARLWLLDELLPWTKDHCAFCDGMGGTTQWPVEHFKPKAKFPDDAYAWENLYPCCERCQGKGAEWLADLLRPDEEGYAFDTFFFFDFTADDGVALCPRSQRAGDLIRLYKLDDSERRKARMAEWHFWDPPPHDDPHALPVPDAAQLEFWGLASQNRRLCVERFRAGHLDIDSRPYRDLGEEVLSRLAAALETNSFTV